MTAEIAHEARNSALPDILPELRRATPELRGTLEAHAPLAGLSFFKTGGPAQALFEPADEDDLAYFLARLDPSVPLLALGLGSNVLLRDGGVEGVVIRLGRAFQDIAVEGLSLTAGAGAPDVKLASAAAKAGVAGLSFLRGIPGSIGGALRMNAGAYGAEIKDVFLSCRGVDRAGKIHVFSNADMGFSYRHCGVANDVIFTQATFVGAPGDSEAILADMAEITKARAATQPVNTRTGGSTFKNPPGQKAWELIDRAGCRGLAVGDAQVSELHCNFLVNRGAASAADLETLGEIVRARVFETSGVNLEWEILRVGAPR
ncbi:UDP-N-acetylmuramate dehydrogenase [Methylocapsa polymorpha]|uniref:UDP-N-acetylenolpyruvoylglucosamine reductase n=1 Tax=Methylocapsa polymorpha TaxID=3080828 RepID=A0ABZ0HMN1_9HYPH|nr:UDP-N-acetylmuramate dehydrogenase [Methylocapsa sp. RX1]